MASLVKRPLALLLALACARSAPRPDPSPAAEPDPLPAIRAQVEELLAAQGEAWWKSWTTGAPLDAAATYRGKDRVLAPASLERVRAALSKASGDERRALSHLRAFLVGERLSQATAEAAERRAGAETRTTFTWERREIPLRQLGVLLAQEPLAERRAALEKAQAPAAARLASLVAAEDGAFREAIRALGYAGPHALAAELRAEPVESLAALAEAVLRATEESYRTVMEGLARTELERPLAAVRWRDLPRLFYTAHEPRAFPAGRLGANADATLAALGLPRTAIAGLTLDLEPRAGKSPRPLALPVRPPGDVRLSAVGLGGAPETRAFLHELGAALYYAHVRAPAAELRRLGPAHAAGTWARLFEGLAGDPTWLAERTGLGNHALAREVRAALAEDLHEVRLLAARLLLEVASAPGGAPPGEIRARLLSQALARPLNAGEAGHIRLDPDPLLQSAESLRAVLLGRGERVAPGGAPRRTAPGWSGPWRRARGSPPRRRHCWWERRRSARRPWPPAPAPGSRPRASAPCQLGLELLELAAQLAIAVPAGGHVADDGGGPEDGAGVVADELDGELDGQGRSVLAHGRHGQGLLAVAGDAGLHHLLPALPVPCPQALRDDDVHRLAHRLGGGVAEHRLGAGVPEPDASLPVGIEDGVASRLHDAGMEPLWGRGDRHHFLLSWSGS
jgi:hypothetical protein